MEEKNIEIKILDDQRRRQGIFRVEEDKSLDLQTSLQALVVTQTSSAQSSLPATQGTSLVTPNNSSSPVPQDTFLPAPQDTSHQATQEASLTAPQEDATSESADTVEQQQKGVAEEE